MKAGDSLEVTVKAPGAQEDFEGRAKKAGQAGVETKRVGKSFVILIRKSWTPSSME
jgi:TusA-related sulfurtransferase